MPAVHTTLSNCYVPLPAIKPPTKINPITRPDGSTSTSSKSTSKFTSTSKSSTNAANNNNHTHTRNAKTIRRLCIDRHILSSSTGSSLIELGHTKVLCSVHGPRPLSSSSMPSGGGGSDSAETGKLHCQIRYAPHFGMRPETTVMNSATNLDGYGYGASTSGTTSSSSSTLKETQLSARLQDAIAPSMPLELLQKNVVDVFVMVLQDDGESSVWVASVMAASLALSDAGVEIYDLVSAFSVAVIPRECIDIEENKNQNENDMDVDVDVDVDEEASGISKSDSKYYLLADPDEDELAIASSSLSSSSRSSSSSSTQKIVSGGGGVITMAMMKNWKEVVFWDQTGRLPPGVATEAAELCREGCTIMHRFMRQALVGKKNEE